MREAWYSKLLNKIIVHKRVNWLFRAILAGLVGIVVTTFYNRITCSVENYFAGDLSIKEAFSSLQEYKKLSKQIERIDETINKKRTANQLYLKVAQDLKSKHEAEVEICEKWKHIDEEDYDNLAETWRKTESGEIPSMADAIKQDQYHSYEQYEKAWLAAHDANYEKILELRRQLREYRISLNCQESYPELAQQPWNSYLSPSDGWTFEDVVERYNERKTEIESKTNERDQLIKNRGRLPKYSPRFEKTYHLSDDCRRILFSVDQLNIIKQFWPADSRHSSNNNLLQTKGGYIPD